MNQIRFMAVVIVVLMLQFPVYAAEAKGYKIVLASFGTFDEAKEKLDRLGQKLGAQDEALQKKYGYQIAARPSGKAFMLAVEPIESKEDSEKILKQFHLYYPDAYVNGYYGPTEGAVFLKAKENVQSEEQNTSEANQSVPELQPAAEENLPVQSQALSAPSQEVSQSPSESTIFSKIGNLGIVLLALMMAMLFWFWKRKIKIEVQESPKERYEESRQEETSEDLVYVIESEAVKDEPDIQEKIPAKLFEPQSDIFDKLKKNMFFMTLLGELKTAAEVKDEQQCKSLMDEVMKYQKNFRASEKIARIQSYIETKRYDELSTYINKEMD